MSSTVNFTIYKDHSVASGSVTFGNYNDQHAPIGLYSGWVRAQLMQFNLNFSGMGSIVSAKLYMKSTGQVHQTFGSSPTLRAKRNTSSWTGSGGAEGSWVSAASPKGAWTGATTTGQSSATNMTRTENTWDTIDITSIVRAWAPATVTGGGAAANYGLVVKAESEASSADGWEFFTQNSSYDPYIKVVYDAPVVTPPPPEEPPPPPPANVAPTATVIAPEDGSVPDLAYTLNYGDGVPYPTVQWSFYDPDAGAYQSAYRVVITDTSDNYLFDSGKVAGTGTTLAIPALDGANVWTSGTYYRVYVMVWDELDLESNWSSYNAFRILFGMAEFSQDFTTAPTSWRVNSIGSSGTVYVEYNSSTNGADPGAGLGAWQTNIAAVPKQSWFRWRVWLLPSENGATFGQLDYFNLGYTVSGSTTPVPDIWTLVGDATVTSETRVYGSKSLRMEPGGYARQRVEVLPNTTYQFTARLKQDVLSADHYISLINQAQTLDVAIANSSQTTLNWHTVNLEWYSGENTWIYVQAANYPGEGVLWADALKMEASPVATPWTPAQVGGGTVEAGGICLSGIDGDTFRLKGSANGLTDTVELGAYGLVDGYSNVLGSPHGGHNLLRNGGFRDGLSGWTFEQDGDTTANASLWDITSAEWTLRDGDTADFAGGGVNLGSSMAVYSNNASSKTPYVRSDIVPVTAGLPYSLSALVGAHRPTSVYAVIWCYDKDGTALGSAASPVLSYDSNYLGGAWLSGWRRLDINGFIAPTDATHCSVVLVQTTPYVSATDMYVFWDQVMLTQSPHAMPYIVPAKQNSGTTFPGSPTTGDRYYRTDHMEEFVYDGTLWLCTNAHALSVPLNVALPISANAEIGYVVPPFPLSGGVYITHKMFHTFVDTTNNGTHYWKLDLAGAVGGAAGTQLNTSADSAGWKWHSQTIGAEISGSEVVLYVTASKNNSPGPLWAGCTIGYRHTAT